MRRLLRLLLCSAAVAASAQNLPPGIHPFRTYGTEAGLGNLAAMRLAQDSAGFLWVATQDGVYRYDGNRFTRFGLEHGLPSSFVSSIKAAPDGTLWIGTYNGVAHFDGRRFHAIGKPAGLPDSAPNAIAVDEASRIWIATTKGLFRGTSSGGFAHVTSDSEATAVWFDAQSRAIWSAGVGSVRCLMNGKWMLFREGLANERIDAVVVDRDRRVWARSATHLWSKAENANAFVDETAFLPATSSNGYLALDRRGNLWVPTDRGLAFHDERGWRVIGAAEGLPTEWARDVMEDREGSMWVASLGVHRMLGRGEFTSYNRKCGLPNDVTWAFRWDREGRLLVGTDLGLARSNGKSWSIVPGTERDQIRALAVEPSGVVWAGSTPPAVLRVGGNNVQRYQVSGRSVLALALDREGALWVATRGSGLLRKAAGDDHFVRVEIPGGAAEESFRFVMEDTRGRIWATGENGVACLDGGSWRRYTTRDGLSNDNVAYLMETAAGAFWAAYFEPLGIVRFRLGASGALQIVERRDTRNGLSANKAFLLGRDRLGRVWVGTGVGVDLLDGALTQHYSVADGLAGDDTDATAFFADQNGDVFIGTSAGFSRYAPRVDPPRIEPPPVRLMSTSIDKRTFAASFAALSFFKDDLLETQARLVGLDDEWHSVAARDVHYMGLAPGNYRFEVRARLKPGEWSAASSTDFTIAPAWWQTIWARIGALLLLVALIWLVFRGRVALLRHRNLELEALVEQRTRELEQANAKLLDLSVTDALTGMRNRRYLELCMPEYTADALRRHETLLRAGVDPCRANGDLVFLLLDLDHFKEVNDHYGHLAGDAVLVQLHELLRTTMRETDTLIRWGGEEFLFVARNSSRHDAAALAERIRVTVGSYDFTVASGIILRLTCSVGFAAYPFLPEDRTRAAWEEVVGVADTCLYLAKRRGRNCTIGAIAGDSRDPQTLLTRIRTSFDSVVAAGELSLVGATELRAPNAV